MPPSSEDQPEARRVLRQLITAFSDPGAADAGLAARVVADARALLGEDEVVELRRRMPTRLFPHSAVDEVPDPPPVPPAAL